jgi:hypothetical protein
MGLFGLRELQLCGAHVSDSSIGLGVEADGALEYAAMNQIRISKRLVPFSAQPIAIRRG